MKKKITTIMIFIVFLAGLSLLLYPFVADQWNSYRQTQLITSYDEAVSDKMATGEIDRKRELEKAHAYNDALIPYILPDSFAAAAAASGEDDREYRDCLNPMGDGMMGYVEISKIDVRIPIFHTTEEDVLRKGAGHLPGSSLPVGGKGTHAVISAHRGLPSASLFTDLDKLEKGDHFLLYILDEILCYQVDRISVVKPSDTSGLAAEDGKDLVTLLTCTPYGVNSHRLLVRGVRVPYEEVGDEETPTSLFGPSLHTSYLLWVIVGLTATGIAVWFLRRLEQKRRAASIRNRRTGDGS